MSNVDDVYLAVARRILNNGHEKSDRTGTGTTSAFGESMVFSLIAGEMPLLTTKKLVLRSIIHELIWFLRGEGNIQYLRDKNVGIWDAWADENGDLGPVYGVQWRHWQDTRVIDDTQVEAFKDRGFTIEGEIAQAKTMTGRYVATREIDQIQDVLNQLRTNPDSRRIILTAWNPAVIEEQALPPCHSFIQFYTHELDCTQRQVIALERIKHAMNAGYELNTMQHALLTALQQDNLDEKLLDDLVPKRALSCHLYQRSGDFFLGVPFNIASYALLTHMIAACVGMEAFELVHTIGDGHLYSNHRDQIEEQLKRCAIPGTTTVRFLRTASDPGEFAFEDIEIIGYNSHPPIKAPISV